LQGAQKDKKSCFETILVNDEEEFNFCSSFKEWKEVKRRRRDTTEGYQARKQGRMAVARG